jgi:hypothetical protein
VWSHLDWVPARARAHRLSPNAEAPVQSAVTTITAAGIIW